MNIFFHDHNSLEIRARILPKLLFFCHNPGLPVIGKWFARRKLGLAAFD